MGALVIGLGLLGLGVCLVGVATDRIGLRAIGKLTASSGFLGLAAALDLSHSGAHAPWVFGALVLCWLGDALLLFKAKKVFLAGLVSFLLGHVAYAGALATLGLDGVGAGVTALGVVALLGAVWRWLAPHTGSLKPAVASYVVVIGAMMVLAGGAAVSGSEAGRPWLLVAAVMFAASDIFVARHRFVDEEPVNRYAGLPLYFLAQYLFVWAFSAS